MRFPALGALTLAGTFAMGRNAGADEVVKGPYLQHLTSSGVDVRVELSSSSALTLVVSAAEPDAGHFAPVTVASSAAVFHSVHVDGLAPATRYRYSVRPAGGPPHQAEFTTAPAPSSHAPFRFIVYGDNRSNSESHARVAAAIEKENFDFLVHTGDMVIAGSDEAAWQSFFDVEEPILASHCLFAAIGNHELADDRAADHFEKYFAPTNLGAARTASVPPFYGTFRWGRARFFLLNAFEAWGPGRERSWLESSLAESDKEADVDLRVAVIHHGPYSAGLHGSNTALLAAHVDDLLRAHHVDLVVAGHDHIFERGEERGLKYIVSGGTGAPLYRDIRPLPSTRKVEATYHYVLVTVSDEGVSTIARRPDGTIVDECSFVRGGSWRCDPVVTPPSSSGGGGPKASPSADGTQRSRCDCAAPGASRTTAPYGWMTAAVIALWAVRRRSVVPRVR